MEKGFHPTFHWLLILPIFIVLWPSLIGASETDLEKTLQAYLEESRTVAGRSREKAGSSFSAEIEKLKALAEEIRPLHLLLSERFRLREEKLGSGKVQQHHQAMSEGYRRALDEYLALIEGLSPSGDGSESTLHQIRALLDKILYRKRLPLLGSLPYRNLRYSLKEPNNHPPLTPAYRGGDRSVRPGDLIGPRSPAIAVLAQSLNWNPVLIYEWVKNNVETEWYWGCMKGAEETLRQKSGNDCDQAALLVALLRAAGFPARYVRGVIEFFPDIARAKNLIGIDDEGQLALFLQKSGIPFQPVVAGGKISNLQIEHLWVETQAPYANYRGAVLDDQGKSWLGLDTSIKATGYVDHRPLDLLREISLLNIRDDYLSSLQTQTPLEYTRTRIEAYLAQNHPGTGYADLLRRRTLIPEVMNILPADLQFREIKVTHEYPEIPEELTHRVRIAASGCELRAAGCRSDRDLFDVTLDASELSNRSVAISYEPDTVEDQEIIDSYGGLDNTPAYLVRLRPVLKVDGERKVVGRDGLPMGADYPLTIEFISPQGTEKMVHGHIAGNLAVIGIVSQKAVLPQEIPIEEKDAERLLSEEALRYTDRWNQAEEELAALMHFSLARPVPTLVTVGGMIDVTYLLDAPHGFAWKGVFVDAAFRAVSAVACCVLRVEEEREKEFMKLSGLQGSVLEHRILEDDFQVPSISTAKLFSLVNSQPATGNAMLTLDRSNASALLLTLPFAEEIKEDIRNAVNQDWIVKIPSAEVTFEDWNGIGYLKENTETGEAGWMLSGSIAGASSGPSPEKWVLQHLAEKLGHPYAGEVNEDPLAGSALVKILVGDKQTGIVGQPLEKPVAVFVRDRKFKPVKGARVTFKVLAGNGTVGVPAGTTVTVPTGPDGIAKAVLTLGQRTADNPFYLKIRSEDLYYSQVGLNLVTASVKGTSGEIVLTQPFEAHGKPDEPDHLFKGLGEGNINLANNPSGTVRVKLEDRYGNPVSNRKITFKALDPEMTPVPTRPFRNIQFYLRESCPNPYPIAGDCSTLPTVDLISEVFGAQVETLLGDTIGTRYTVQVTAEGVPAVIFTLFSSGDRGGKYDYIPPVLYIRSLETVNEKGQPVNAAKAGTALPAPLVSRIFKNHDDYTMAGPHPCPHDSARSCWKIEVSGIRRTEPVVDGTVTYRVAQGAGSVTPTENLGEGRYQARYTTGSLPFKNEIEAVGEAAIVVPEVHYDPSTLGVLLDGYETATLPERTLMVKTGQSIRFHPETRQPLPMSPSIGTDYTVYGVETKLTVEPILVLLNQEGFTTSNTAFKYTILPADYNAVGADIDLFKEDAWVGYLIGDHTQIEGRGVALRGSEFDINKKYEAEAVLNRGSEMEIRSGVSLPAGQIRRTVIPLGQLQLLDDKTSDPVAGGVTDGVTKLRLKLTVKQNREALPPLTWRILDRQLPTSTVATGTLLEGEEPKDDRPVVFDTQGVAEALYRVPETFVRFGTEKEEEDKEEAEREIDITLNHFLVEDPPIRLKRPPVVLVHGLWGDGRENEETYTWKMFEPQLNIKTLFDITSVDYHGTNAHGFSDNARFVRLGIKEALSLSKSQGLAATKVDLITHSMGGLLVREYCGQVPECKDHISKLVTLDTPHTGSELASLIVNQRGNPDSCVTSLIVPALHNDNKRTDLGAVDDLAISSAALKRLVSISLPFPVYTIAGLTQDFLPAYDPSLKKLWRWTSSLCGFVPGPSPTIVLRGWEILDSGSFIGISKEGIPVFSQANDRIVSQSSQLEAASAENRFPLLGFDHTTIHDDAEVARLVINLLERSTQSP